HPLNSKGMSVNGSVPIPLVFHPDRFRARIVKAELTVQSVGRDIRNQALIIERLFFPSILASIAIGVAVGFYWNGNEVFTIAGEIAIILD
ncbi:hypothetical protein ACW7EJ_05355, partial [Acinetobacter soli]